MGGFRKESSVPCAEQKAIAVKVSAIKRTICLIRTVLPVPRRRSPKSGAFACDEALREHSSSAARSSEDRSSAVRVASSATTNTRPDSVPERRQGETPTISARSVHEQNPKPTGCDESWLHPRLPIACSPNGATDGSKPPIAIFGVFVFFIDELE